MQGTPKQMEAFSLKKGRVWQTLTGQGRGAEIVLGSSISQAEELPVCRKSGRFSSAEGRSFCAPGQQCTGPLGGAVKRHWAAIWGYPWASLKPRVWAPLAAQPLLTTVCKWTVPCGVKSPFVRNVPFILTTVCLKVTSSQSSPS